MKKFNVSEKCNGCGLCICMSDLLTEDELGFAHPKASKYICDDYAQQADEIVSMCPVNAISVTEEKDKTLKELADELETKLKKIGKAEITEDMYYFDYRKYKLEPLDTNIGSEYKYPSEDKAASVGVNYLDAQINTKIYEALSKYKNEMFMPFYTSDGSYYVDFNKKFVQVLSEVYAAAKCTTGNEINLSDDFVKFDVYPDDQYCYDWLRTFERGGDYSGRGSFVEIIRAKREKYTKWTCDYWIYVNSDCIEEYIGEGFFGSKYKRRYNCDLRECEEKMRNDIDDAIYDIQERIEYAASEDLTICLNNYNEKIEKAIEEKVEQFRTACSLPSMKSNDNSFLGF